MAHNITRIEGFEGGETVGSTSLFLDAVIGTPEVVVAAARSGDYGLRIVAPSGAGTEAATLAYAYGITGAADLINDIDAVADRHYVRFTALPTAGTSAEFFALKDSSDATVVRGDINSAGRVLLDGTPGTTVIALNTWTRLELKSDGLTTMTLRINGVDELTMAPVGDPTNRISFGKSSTDGGTGGYTCHFDDVVIESSNDVVDIDYPGPGQILRLETDGDGFYDAVWTSTTDPSAYLSAQTPDNGDTDRILSPASPGTGNQTCTLESATGVGIGTPIGAVQFSGIIKRIGNTDTSVELIAREAGVNTILSSPTVATTSYANYASVQRLSPFSLALWTATELDGIEFGAAVVIIV